MHVKCCAMHYSKILRKTIQSEMEALKKRCEIDLIDIGVKIRRIFFLSFSHFFQRHCSEHIWIRGGEKWWRKPLLWWEDKISFSLARSPMIGISYSLFKSVFFFQVLSVYNLISLFHEAYWKLFRLFLLIKEPSHGEALLQYILS